jgi:7-keto-8-aminopelargonate synthetase-like enzyme
VDGCLLSRASVYRYRHGDVEHLESMLRDADRRGQKRKLIVTESIFSMDGDTAPLREIAELRDRFGAALMVDEAHALGVFGGEGRGYSDALGITDKVDIHVGTFGKSLGSYGAYVAGAEQWIDCLLNTARTFIFSTALPPAVIGAVDASLDLVRAADARRSHILELASSFRSQLSALGANVLNSTTQIVPVVIGSSAKTLQAARVLEEAGVWARAIRSPTVPRNTSRLRFSLTSFLTCDDVSLAVSAVASCLGDNDDGDAT